MWGTENTGFCWDHLPASDFKECAIHSDVKMIDYIRAPNLSAVDILSKTDLCCEDFLCNTGHSAASLEIPALTLIGYVLLHLKISVRTVPPHTVLPRGWNDGRYVKNFTQHSVSSTCAMNESQSPPTLQETFSTLRTCGNVWRRFLVATTGRGILWPCWMRQLKMKWSRWGTWVYWIIFLLQHKPLCIVWVFKNHGVRKEGGQRHGVPKSWFGLSLQAAVNSLGSEVGVISVPGQAEGYWPLTCPRGPRHRGMDGDEPCLQMKEEAVE